MSAVVAKPSDIARLATEREQERRQEAERQEAERREAAEARGRELALTERRRRESEELEALGVPFSFRLRVVAEGLTHDEAVKVWSHIGGWFLMGDSLYGTRMRVDLRYYKNAVVDEGKTHEETITNLFLKFLREDGIPEEEIQEALTAFKDCEDLHVKVFRYAISRTTKTVGPKCSHAELLEMLTA